MNNPDKDLLGLTQEEVESVLNEEGTKFRYDFIDDQNQIGKDVSYDIDRVTMTMRDGKIVATSRG